MNKNNFFYKLIEGKTNGQQNSHNYLTFSKQAAAYHRQVLLLHDFKKFRWDNNKWADSTILIYIYAPDFILKIRS